MYQELLQLILVSGKVFEEGNNVYTFRNPQYPSRRLIIENEPGNITVRFVKMPPDFKLKWGLNVDAKLIKPITKEECVQLMDEFFFVEDQQPPVNAPPFEEVVEHCKPIMIRLCNRYKRDSHYELNYEDLWCYAMMKIHECWVYAGDKPMVEFEKILSASIWNKFQTLLSRHFQTERRSGAPVFALTDDFAETIPDREMSDKWTARLDSEDFHQCIKSMHPVDQFIVTEIIQPSGKTRMSLALDNLRFKKVRAQGQKRIPTPTVDMKRLSRASSFTEAELSTAWINLTARLNLPQNLMSLS